MRKSSDNPFKNPIVLAALIIAGGLIVGGYMFSNGSASVMDEGAIEKGIEAYIEKQQEQQAAEQKAANQPQEVSGISTDDDAILGNPDAKVTVIEFSDYECPFCKRFADNTLAQIKTNYIDTGKVKFVYRDFPLTSIHRNAMGAAMAAECAGDQGDDKYYEMHDKIFANQTALSEANLKRFAEEIGLNTGTFNDCFDNETHKAEIEKDMADGRAAGVTGTPGSFVNGWFVKGAQPYSVFEELIEQELAK